MSTERPSGPGRGRPRGVRLWEAVVLAVVVGAGTYFAGLRTGAERERLKQSAAPPGDAHSGMGMPGAAAMAGGAAPSSPSAPMDAERLKANLAKISDVSELIGIANQHLDNARSVEEQGQGGNTKVLYSIAVAAYERALELKPKDPNLLTDLGIAYRGLGDSQKAVERFQEAAQADPNHLQSRYNLGLVLLDDLHDEARAKAAWEEYLRLAPKTDPNRPQVEQQLQKLH